MRGSGPTIVKLGGSILTRKQGKAALRPKLLGRLARELATPDLPRLILLHGAGSFGHPGAVRWHLAEAPGGETGIAVRRRRGASIVQAEVRLLHRAVVASLLEIGLNPWSIPIATHAENEEGKLKSLEVAPFQRALEQETLPVSFGDVVPDTAWGFSILSADTIAIELARQLDSPRVIFVSDVPGVLAPNVGGPPKIVAEATPELVDRLRPESGGMDATGGIQGKVAAMIAIAAAGADAGLISGLTDGALSHALRGERVYGTWAQAVPR